MKKYIKPEAEIIVSKIELLLNMSISNNSADDSQPMYITSPTSLLDDDSSDLDD